MKRILTICIAAFLLQIVLLPEACAQKRGWGSNGAEISAGVNQFPFQFKKDEKALKNWEELSFYLMQRFYAGDGAMRIVLDFYILPKTDYKYYVTGFNVGYAHYFDIYYPNLRFFAGGDIRFQLERDEFPNYATSDLRFGLLPNGGLQFRVSPRFSVSTELAYFLAIQQRRTDVYVPDTNVKDSNRIGLIGRQHRLFSLGLGFIL